LTRCAPRHCEARSDAAVQAVARYASPLQAYFIIRDGRPVARLLPMTSAPKKRIGVAQGKFTVPDDIDPQNADIAHRFYGKD
jgi:hypothetical protein